MLDVYLDNEDDVTMDMQPSEIQITAHRKSAGKRCGPARLKPFYEAINGAR